MKLVMNNTIKRYTMIGEKLTYDDLTITFIVDENLENYIEIHNWINFIRISKR